MAEPTQAQSDALRRTSADPPRTGRVVRGRRFFLPLTGAWILGLDWLLFSQSVLSVGLALPSVMLLGFMLGGVGTLFFQRRIGRDRWSSATLKALLAGLVVGAPWPVLGTIVGGWVLVASGIASHADQDVSD
jgi:hypothetical protein